MRRIIIAIVDIIFLITKLSSLSLFCDKTNAKLTDSRQYPLDNFNDINIEACENSYNY